MSRSGEEDMPERVTDSAPPAVEGRRFTSASSDREPAVATLAPPIFDVRDVSVYYGDHRAIADVSLGLQMNRITALIGPSGCGKSTFIRCLNRMNDLIP